MEFFLITIKIINILKYILMYLYLIPWSFKSRSPGTGIALSISWFVLQLVWELEVDPICEMKGGIQTVLFSILLF